MEDKGHELVPYAQRLSRGIWSICCRTKSSRTWIALTAAMLLVPFSAVSAVAQSTSEVMVSVLPPADGVLHASIEAASFGSVEYTPETAEDQVASGMIQLHVIDSTGLGSPWSVRVRADSDFINPDDQRTIASSNLRLAQPSLRLQKNASALSGVQPIAVPVASLGTGRSTLLAHCPTGNCQGEFVLEFPSELRVPAGTLVGTYRTTLIVEVLAGDE